MADDNEVEIKFVTSADTTGAEQAKDAIKETTHAASAAQAAAEQAAKANKDGTVNPFEGGPKAAGMSGQAIAAEAEAALAKTALLAAGAATAILAMEKLVETVKHGVEAWAEAQVATISLDAALGR